MYEMKSWRLGDDPKHKNDLSNEFCDKFCMKNPKGIFCVTGVCYKHCDRSMESKEIIQTAGAAPMTYPNSALMSPANPNAYEDTEADAEEDTEADAEEDTEAAEDTEVGKAENLEVDIGEAVVHTHANEFVVKYLPSVIILGIFAIAGISYGLFGHKCSKHHTYHLTLIDEEV